MVKKLEDKLRIFQFENLEEYLETFIQNFFNASSIPIMNYSTTAVVHLKKAYNYYLFMLFIIQIK